MIEKSTSSAQRWRSDVSGMVIEWGDNKSGIRSDGRGFSVDKNYPTLTSAHSAHYLLNIMLLTETYRKNISGAAIKKQ